MSEMMVPVDPKCVPDGWNPSRYGYGEIGETVAQHDTSGQALAVKITRYSTKFPRIIIRKNYDPGIDCIPTGWWVWQQLDAKKSWVATPSKGGCGDDVAIYGLQNLLGFNPTPDGQPRQVN